MPGRWVAIPTGCELAIHEAEINDELRAVLEVFVSPGYAYVETGEVWIN